MASKMQGRNPVRVTLFYFNSYPYIGFYIIIAAIGQNKYKNKNFLFEYILIIIPNPSWTKNQWRTSS